jgi:hypothetical protein
MSLYSDGSILEFADRLADEIKNDAHVEHTKATSWPAFPSAAGARFGERTLTRDKESPSSRLGLGLTKHLEGEL